MRWMVMAGLIAVGVGTPATAQNAMQACGAKYRAAKTAGAVPAGQTWPRFLAACRSSLPAAATATAATPAPKAGAVPARQPTPGQIAARARMKQCSAQYHADKDTGKLPTGQSWPKYYSACNARLKG